MERKTRSWVLSLVFFVLFLVLILYYQFAFQPHLYYHLHQPIFLFNRTFVNEFLSYPGGLIELITQFFFQFFYYNFAGALIMGLLTVGIWVMLYRIVERLRSSEINLSLAFLPVILLLLLQNRYNFPLVITFKYLCAIAFFDLYLQAGDKGKIILIISSVLFYYLVGGWVFLFWIVLTLLDELFFGESPSKYYFSALLVGFYLLCPLIASRYLFFIGIREAYLYIVPSSAFFEPFMFRLTVLLYLFFIALPILLPGIFIFDRFIIKKPADSTAGKRRNPVGKLSLSLFLILGQSIIIIVAVYFGLHYSFDENEQKQVRIDYLAYQGRWSEIIKQAQTLKSYDRLTNFNVNRALYHTGQLLDNLFAMRQMLGTDGLFINKVIASQIAIPASELYFDLGHIKAAEAMAFEAQTKFRYNPRILKQLSLTSLINEKYSAAQKFITLLSSSIIYCKWAKHYQVYIDNPDLCLSDELIQLKRAQQPHTDFFINNEHPDYDLIRLLKEDPDNRMAFEYLIAYNMLDSKLKNVYKHLDKYSNFNYQHTPRHLQETLILLKLRNPQEIDISKYNISHEVVERFSKFNTILMENINDHKKAQSLLASEFGNTLWYYIRYISPLVTNLELKVKKIDEDIY
jgi:hypothetical protein